MVAHVGELADGQLPVGFPGMAADESQFAIARAFRIPFQKMLDLGRLAVFVSAENADIEIVARILEVIGIAAVKGHLLLGREDDPHIVVAFVAIQMVNAALVKRDDIGAQPGLVLALLFNRGDGGVARVGRLIARHSRLHARCSPRSVTSSIDMSTFSSRSVALISSGLRLRVETVAHVIVFLAADFLERVGADVMIGDDETVRGNERAAPAGVETDARFLQMLEPLRRRLELILLFELFERRIVEQPHSFIGECGRSHPDNKEQD